MSLSDVFAWLMPAVLVFWAVGAYNRLVRLRSAARQSYAALHAGMVRQSELLQSALANPGAGATAAGEGVDPVALSWRGLAAALQQFNALLAATRLRALDAEAVAALTTARSVLEQAWQRVQDEGQDLAGAPVPESLLIRWVDLSRDAGVAAQQFNEAVGAYNDAVRQFPAVLLAWVFRFRPASAV
jgi:LemA protein